MTNVYSKERHQVIIYRLNYNGFTLYTHNAIQVAVYNGFVDDSYKGWCVILKWYNMWRRTRIF